jgi:hypothetical protein
VDQRSKRKIFFTPQLRGHHAATLEVVASPPSRSPHRRLRGDRTAAFKVAALPPSRWPLDPLNPPRLRRPSLSQRSSRRHLRLLLTAPASNSDYNQCRPPQPPSPSCRRLWFRRAATIDTFLTVTSIASAATSKPLALPPRSDPESRCSCNRLCLPVRGSTSPPAPRDHDPAGHLVCRNSSSITMLATSCCNIYILSVATSF